MILGELFPGEVSEQEAWIPVSGLTADSRAVAPGSRVLRRSRHQGGRAGLRARRAEGGAVAVVSEAGKPADFPADRPFIHVPDVRHALAMAAATGPSRPAGDRGRGNRTSGKTSVAEFTRQILAACGRQAASLGTIGVVAPSGAHYGSLTTPDPVTLHEMLETLQQEGVTHLAMEASSHGLDQRRLDGVELAAGAFTNLGRDHLDYHPTVEDYLKAKLRLFETLLPDGATAVVNADGEHAKEVIEAVKARGLKLMTVGRARQAAPPRLAGARRVRPGDDRRGRGPTLRRAHSARGRFPGVQRAGRGWRWRWRRARTCRASWPPCPSWPASRAGWSASASATAR